MSTKAVTQAPAGPVAITKKGSILVEAAQGTGKEMQRMVQQTMQAGMSTAKSLEALMSFCAKNRVGASDVSTLTVQLGKLNRKVSTLIFASAQKNMIPVSNKALLLCVADVNTAVAGFVEDAEDLTGKDAGELANSLMTAFQAIEA